MIAQPPSATESTGHEQDAASLDEAWARWRGDPPAEDDPDLVDCGRRYARAARAARDEVVHLERPGDHFAIIDPATPLWQATAAQIESRMTSRVRRPGA
jgi:hypothetical protein